MPALKREGSQCVAELNDENKTDGERERHFIRSIWKLMKADRKIGGLDVSVFTEGSVRHYTTVAKKCVTS